MTPPPLISTQDYFQPLPAKYIYEASIPITYSVPLHPVVEFKYNMPLA